MINLKHIKEISTFILLLLCIHSNAQNDLNYSIKEIKTNYIYYNFVSYKNHYYIGSNIGMLEIKDDEITLKKSEYKGYITINNNTIVGNNLTIVDVKDNSKYKSLLPLKYQSKLLNSLIIGKKLYLISEGVLFIFDKQNFEISYDSLNVRSISKNIIGSYNGIYINGIKIPYPTYTDGTVKEFGEDKFICYGGLLHINSKSTIDYRSKITGEFEINNNSYGKIKDIFKLKQDQYLGVTDLGIFKFNLLQKSKIDTVYFNEKINEHIGIFYTDGNDRIFYHVDDKVYAYSVNKKTNLLYINTKINKTIKDIFTNNLIDFYILYDDVLYKFKESSSSKIEKEILISDLSQSHNIKLFKGNLCISSNLGLHIYDLTTNKLYLNLIKKEINNRSLNIINDTIKAGTLNGILQISENNLIDLLNDSKISKDESKYDNYSIIFYLITIGFIISIIVIVVLLIKRKKQLSLKVIDNSVTKENIIKFIHENITNVSIISICDKFGINTVRLYEILEDEKPGEIIRKHRLNLVRRYRREKKDDQFIAKNTGFSVSYLKKIY